MSQEIYDRVLKHPQFAELTAGRNLFSWILAIIVLVVFFAFVLAVAYRPDFLASPMSEGMTMPMGLVIGVIFNIFCFVMTGIYVARANTRFDSLSRKILSEVSR
ncbi:MAG: DUF485 domain-containing protein [Rhodospirillales bacterium]|nr:DUF485 domain-containing protein [Rhodospirillales bacterium]